MDKQFVNDVFQWDVRNWSKALHLWDNHLTNLENKRAMTFGEREGGLTLFLASKGVHVICTDYNDFPEETRALHERYNVSEFVTYEKQDITDIDAPNNSVDIVMFKSVIGALGSDERQQQAIKEIHRILKPEGCLLLAENIRGSGLHAWTRKKFTKWAAYWHYPEYKKRASLFAPFSKHHFATFGFFGAFGRSEKQRNILGAMDDVLKPIIPVSRRYILFAVVQK